MSHPFALGLVASTILFTLPSFSFAAASAARCEADKHKVSGGYYQCLEKAQASSIKSGQPLDTSRCDEKFLAKWQAADDAGQGLCPDDSTSSAVQNLIQQQGGLLDGILAGDDVPSCGDDTINVAGEQCDGADLGGETCASLGFVSGTLSCAACSFDTSGCSLGGSATCGNGIGETGEDCDGSDMRGATCQTLGSLYGSAGCTAGCAYDTSDCTDTRFVDNGNATISDNQTGLMWEKKASINANNSPTFTTTWFGVQDTIAPIYNSTTDPSGCTEGFGGHCDWRLPTFDELKTILLAPYPCMTNPCIDSTFGATASGGYLTYTTYGYGSYLIHFENGQIESGFDPNTSAYFRAVRGPD